MVHADSSNFAEGVTKTEAYKQVLEQAEALFEGQRNWHGKDMAGRKYTRDEEKKLKRAQGSYVLIPRMLLVSGPNDSNLSNAASLLFHAYHSLPEPSARVNWAGFYVRDGRTPEQLILGPFQGKVACQTIKFGKGVCGTAAERRETVLVEDVEEFPGHIACDGDSQSEIVVPILGPGGKVVAIIDIDCAMKKGFDGEDKKALEDLAKLLASSCDW